MVVNRLSVSRIAAALGVAWSTANDAVLAEGQRLLTDQPGRLDGVPVVGVDEHAWRHTRKSDKHARATNYVTVVVDLTPPSAPAPARHGCWRWPRGARSRRSRPGSRPNPRPGATTSSPSSTTQVPATAPPRSLICARNTYNGPTEAINRRLERLRGPTLGSRNPSPITARGQRPQTRPTPSSAKSPHGASCPVPHFNISGWGGRCLR